MKHHGTEPPKWAGTIWTLVGYIVILGAFAGAFFLAFRGCGANAQVIAMPGDTMRVVGVCVDSLGSARIPDSARLFVLRDGSIVDSTKYYPGGGLTAVSNWNKALQGTYIISGAGTYPIDLQFLMRYSWEGFLGDQARVSPSIVRVNPRVKNVSLVDLVTLTTTTTNVTEEITASIGAVDSIAPSAIEDFYQGVEDNTAAVADTNSCTPCGVYTAAGDPAAVGHVWLTNTATLRTTEPGRNVRVETRATNGYWTARIPLQHARPDTVWVWGWTGTDWSPQGTRLIITELD